MQVKTIGDAYIVCAGALSDAADDDAERVVQMGLRMQAPRAVIPAVMSGNQQSSVVISSYRESSVVIRNHHKPCGVMRARATCPDGGGAEGAKGRDRCSRPDRRTHGAGDGGDHRHAPLPFRHVGRGGEWRGADGGGRRALARPRVRYTPVHVSRRPRVTDSTSGPCPRVTDATAELVRHRFECKQGMVESELSAAEFELGIRSTWYVS